MIGVDLFAGAGGMSLGAEWAGIDVQLAIEIDSHAVATYKHNHLDTKVKNIDIADLDRDDLPNGKEAKILFGGPPCRGFSTSNQRTRSSENPSNWLFLEFLRIAKLWKPDWVVFENVKGIVETQNGEFLCRILNGLRDIGYTVSHWVLNAADFGVPQKRFRLFATGSLSGISVDRPKPTTKKPLPVKAAISDLPVLENGASHDWMSYPSKSRYKYAKLMRGDLERSPNHLVTNNAPYVLKRYKHVPQGGNWEDIPARLMKNYTDRTRCHTGIYYRLREDELSVVLGNYRKNMLVHPTQDRGLSVREAARLQSFPDWYEFKGSIGFQQQQVGNAVSPLLAKAVFDAIMNAS